MEIQVHKSETESEISLNLMITLAKEYGEVVENEINDFQEPKFVTNVETDSIESTSVFLNKLVKLNNLFVTADETKRDCVDDFIVRLTDIIFGMVCPVSIFCLDLREDSIFKYNKYITTRITDIEDCFNLLDKGLEETLEYDCDRYIIINECIDFFFEDCDKFVKDIKKLLENPKNHIICISTETTLLTEELLRSFNNRLSFWLGSTRASKLLFYGKNIGCNILLTNECHFSEDFGKTVTTEYIDSFGEELENLLDI